MEECILPLSNDNLGETFLHEYLHFPFDILTLILDYAYPIATSFGSLGLILAICPKDECIYVFDKQGYEPVVCPFRMRRLVYFRHKLLLDSDKGVWEVTLQKDQKALLFTRHHKRLGSDNDGQSVLLTGGVHTYVGHMHNELGQSFKREPEDRHITSGSTVLLDRKDMFRVLTHSHLDDYYVRWYAGDTRITASNVRGIVYTKMWLFVLVQENDERELFCVSPEGVGGVATEFNQITMKNVSPIKHIYGLRNTFFFCLTMDDQLHWIDTNTDSRFRVKKTIPRVHRVLSNGDQLLVGHGDDIRSVIPFCDESSLALVLQTVRDVEVLTLQNSLVQSSAAFQPV